jgi:hypothetical protein
MKPYFIEITNFWAWADKFGGICIGFSINQPLFLQKTKPLYPNPKYLSETGI